MKEIKLLNLYPDLLELYGDSGNIKILNYRLQKRNIKLIIDTYSIGDDSPDFSSYDIIFAGGGTLHSQVEIYNDLVKYKDELKKAIDLGVLFLLINSSYHLFGKIDYNANNINNKVISDSKNSSNSFTNISNSLKGLELLPYSTVYFDDINTHIIGDVVINSNINGVDTKILGFENHNAFVYNSPSPLGLVVKGSGNNETDEEKVEGYFTKNIIATHLHGPLLSLNPMLSDYIISYCLERKYGEKVLLDKLDDSFEENARRMQLDKN